MKLAFRGVFLRRHRLHWLALSIRLTSHAGTLPYVVSTCRQHGKPTKALITRTSHYPFIIFIHSLLSTHYPPIIHSLPIHYPFIIQSLLSIPYPLSMFYPHSRRHLIPSHEVVVVERSSLTLILTLPKVNSLGSCFGLLASLGLSVFLLSLAIPFQLLLYTPLPYHTIPRLLQ